MERLSIDTRELPREMAQAIREDLPYARMGAALPDLPRFEGFRGGLVPFVRAKEWAPFARALHERAPVAMGLKMAELVSNGALVGRDAGLAFLSGYFTHLAIDRVFAPVVNQLVAKERRPGENAAETRRRVEWAQALFHLRDFYGQDLLGDAALREKLRLVKRPGLPRGMGRGLYEMVRVASQESMQMAPSHVQANAWVRGFYLFAFVLSGPLGKTRGLHEGHLSRQELYRGPNVDVPAEVERALEMARDALHRLWRMILRGSFTPRARARFLEAFPEASAEACAA